MVTGAENKRTDKENWVGLRERLDAAGTTKDDRKMQKLRRQRAVVSGLERMKVEADGR